MVEFHAFLVCSLDGFLVGTPGLPTLPGARPIEGYEAFAASIDLVVAGRRTCEEAEAMRTWPYSRPVIALSSRPDRRNGPGRLKGPLEIMSGAPADIAAALTAKGFTQAHVQGAETVGRFLAAGQLATVTVSRAPVILGGGAPLFHTSAGRAELLHLETVDYASGVVQSVYQVDASAGTSAPPTAPAH